MILQMLALYKHIHIRLAGLSKEKYKKLYEENNILYKMLGRWYNSCIWYLKDVPKEANEICKQWILWFRNAKYDDYFQEMPWNMAMRKYDILFFEYAFQ